MRNRSLFFSSGILLFSIPAFAGAAIPTFIAAKCCNAGSTISVYSTSPANLVGTFASGTLETRIILGPTGKVAFLADTGANAVRLVETETQKPAGTIHLTGSPVNLALSPDATRLYVSLQGGGVTVINTATLDEIGSIAESNPSGLAVSPDDKTLFVGNLSASQMGYIDVVNTASLQVTSSYSLAEVEPGTPGIDLAITSSGARVYAISQEASLGGYGFFGFLDVSARSVTQLPGGVSPLSLAISPDEQYVYEGDYYGGIDVYSTATNQELKEIKVGANALGCTPDGREVVATGYGEVSFVSVATGAVISTLPGPFFSNSLAVAPNGKGVYVLNGGPAEVLFGTGQAITGSYKLAAAPQSVAASTKLGLAYVAEQETSAQMGLEEISVLDVSTHKLVSTIPTLVTVDLLLSPDDSKLYVLDNEENAEVTFVDVFDTATNLETEHLGLQSPSPGKSFAHSPDGKQLLVTFGSGYAYIVDTATLTQTGMISSPGQSFQYAAIAADNTTAYLTAQNNVYVANLASEKITATINVGSCLQHVSITPNGLQAWVADADGKQIDVISTATNTVVARIAAPGGPNQIAFTKDGTTAYVTQAGCVCCSTNADPGNKILVIDTATLHITGSLEAGGATQGIAVLR